MKKIKYYVSLLLCFCFLLSPVTAFAYGTADSNIACAVTVKSSTAPVYVQNLEFTENGYFVYDTSKYKQSTLKEIVLSFTYKYDIKKADVMGFDFVMARGRYLGFDFSVDAYAKTNSGARGKTFFKNSGAVNRDTEFTEGDFSYDYSYSSEANSSNTFHIENTAPFSYNGEIDVVITLSNFKYSFSAAELPGVNLGVEVRNISASVESPESGIAQKTLSGLSSIIEYIKNIFTKIGELPSAIGKFVTDLGNKISGLFTNLTKSLSGFFTNMTNSLKGWFENIGSWFTELGDNIKQRFLNLRNNLNSWFGKIGDWFTAIGDRISGFFTDFWNKISNKVNGIVNDINLWWDSVVEWFKNLFIVPDGYLDEYIEKMQNWFVEHFGFLYQSVTIITTLIQSFVTVFSGEGSGVITIPQITLPWGNYVILRSTTFNFDDMINAHSSIKWVFNMIRTMSSAILLITFINYSVNKFNEVLKNRQENDG